MKKIFKGSLITDYTPKTKFVVTVKEIVINVNDTFEVKNRGTAFTFSLSDNKHLIGMSLLNEIVKINNEPYFVKEFERGISEQEGHITYIIIVDKIGSYEKDK